MRRTILAAGAALSLLTSAPARAACDFIHDIGAGIGHGPPAPPGGDWVHFHCNNGEQYGTIEDIGHGGVSWHGIQILLTKAELCKFNPSVVIEGTNGGWDLVLVNC